MQNFKRNFTAATHKKRKFDISENFTANIVENLYTSDPSSPPLIVKREENVRTCIKNYSISPIAERQTPSPSQFPEPCRDIQPDNEVLSSSISRPRFYPRFEKDREEDSEESLDKKVRKEIEKLLENKTSEVRTFVLSQLYHKKGQKWKHEEKKFFQKVYFKSPACYNELQNMGFSMPHVKSVMRWHADIYFPIGLGGNMIDLLKAKCEGMNDLNKKCVLLFDEMSCKMELEYSSKEDKIYGVKDYGKEKRYPVIAPYVLLLMLRGLNSNWKQSIGYYIGKATTDELVEILKDAVEKILDIGYNIVAITGDQGSSNQSAYKKLCCNKNDPYAVIKGKKIMLLFDVPHLFKSVRNNLLKADIKVDHNYISWDILKQIYTQEKNNTLKACFNLSERHLKPSGFDKLSVKLATQVFSLNVSTAIERGIAVNFFHAQDVAKAVYTAESFRKINNLFDNLNSVIRYTANPQRNALSDDEAGKKIVENLKTSMEWIEKWQHMGRMSRPPSFDGIVQTINGILLIWEELRHTQSYLLTSHLNQDPLENSISILRRNKGSYERNPSPYRISRNMRQIAFQNFIPPTTTGYSISNEETLCADFTTLHEDCSEAFTDHEDILEEETEAAEIENLFKDVFPEYDPEEEEIEVFQIIDDEELYEENIEEVEPPDFKITFENNVIVYFAGYIANKMSKATSCDKCSSFMINYSGILDDDILIKLRAYPTEKYEFEHGALTLPTSEFVTYIKEISTHFEKEIKAIIHHNDIVKKLIESYQSSGAQNLCSAHEFTIKKFIFTVFIRFYIRKINKDLKNSNFKYREKLKILKGN